jgi:large subunit ribosomal protein L14e
MLEIGRVCIKLAGRDAGKLGVVVEVVDDQFIILDGQVRRRKVNLRHVEPTVQSVEIKKGATRAECLKALGIKEEKTKTKPKKDKGPRPKRTHVNKKSAVEEKKARKKEAPKKVEEKKE